MRIVFWLTVLAWGVGSIFCTLTNSNHWPLYSMNVFNEQPKENIGKWVFRISTADGSYDVDPGNLLPLEFFAARAFVGELVQKRDAHVLSNLFDYINANSRAVRNGFDERWPKKVFEPGKQSKIQLILKVFSVKDSFVYKITLLKEIIIWEKQYAS